eukprot:849806-Prymnesium_polylepis.2
MPVSAIAEHEPAPSFWQKDACTEQTSPIAPDSISRRISAIAGKKRLHTPWRKKRLRERASSSTRAASSTEDAIDFSQSTARPF